MQQLLGHNDYKNAGVHCTPIAFDERVCVWSLHCACAHVALFVVGLHMNITQLHTHTVQQTHMHKTVTGHV